MVGIPTVNPAQNVAFPDNLEPKFFISKFSKQSLLTLFSSNKRFAALATTHSDYCGALKQATAENLESIAAAEVLKLSFIRQLKTDRLTWFANVLIVTVILFIMMMFTAPKANQPQIQTAHDPSPAPLFQGPRDIYNCPVQAKPRR
jgi:hypothetical protein